MKDLVTQVIIDNPAVRATNYKKMVQNYYNLVTDTYRQGWGNSFHFGLFSGSENLHEAVVTTERMIADKGGFCPDMKLLDIGCGIGGPALNIAEYSGAHITGITIVERQIEIARQRAAERGLSERTEFIFADAMKMPFADESFDGIYMFDAGCYMPDKAAFYKECARVLRPGGVFIGSDWMCKDGLTANEEEKYIEPICRYHAVPHLITLDKLGKYLITAGLEIETLEDLAKQGNLLPNWEILDNKIIKSIHGLVPWLIPPVLRMLTDGGYALLDGARAGAFLIGHWQARKPIST